MQKLTINSICIQIFATQLSKYITHNQDLPAHGFLMSHSLLHQPFVTDRKEHQQSLDTWYLTWACPSSISRSVSAGGNHVKQGGSFAHWLIFIGLSRKLVWGACLSCHNGHTLFKVPCHIQILIKNDVPSHPHYWSGSFSFRLILLHVSLLPVLVKIHLSQTQVLKFPIFVHCYQLFFLLECLSWLRVFKFTTPSGMSWHAVF